MNAGLGIRIKDIRQEVAATFGLTERELLMQTRKRHIAWPRQIAMAMARELTDRSYPLIVREFGLGDHTTALFAVRKVKQRMASDPKFTEAYGSIRERILARHPAPVEPVLAELPMLKPVRLSATFRVQPMEMAA